ncbi:MAG: hypothetical protein R3B69_01630 [Candidatus Paceibacterota bacterium]
MAESSNASFIPKNSKRTQKKVRGTRRIYLLSYVSYVVFFGTLLATVIVFFFSIQVNKSLEASRDRLIEEKNRFSQEDIDGLRHLEKKLIIANDLLNHSTAPSELFSALESVVADNVYFTGFSYQHNVNDTYTVELVGRADALNPVLYQRELLTQNAILGRGDVTSFDYAISESAEDEESDATTALVQNLLGSEDPVITFTFVSRGSVADIPYTPGATAPVNDTEILSVRPNSTGGTVADDTEQGVSEEGVVDSGQGTSTNQGI